MFSFGQPPASQQQPSSSSTSQPGQMFSFSQPQPQQQSQQQPQSLLPSTPAAPLFPAAPNTFNFGGTSAFNSAATNTSPFGPSLFNPAPAAALPSTGIQPPASSANHPFQYIQQCFDPNHINYRFRAFFYNLAEDLTEAQRRERQTTKPVNVSDSLWAQAVNDNPDPSRMIPVQANGFSDLQARAQWEDEALKAQSAKLAELHDRSSKLLRDLDVDITSRLKDAQQRHHQLSLRLLKIMKSFEVLRRSGTKLSTAEIDALAHLKRALGRLRSGALDTANLRTTAFQLTALNDAGRLDAFRSVRDLVVDGPEAAAALQSLLADQQVAISSTIETLQKDVSDLQVMRAGYRPL